MILTNSIYLYYYNITNNGVARWLFMVAYTLRFFYAF